MMQGLAIERAFLAGEAIGIAEAALAEAVSYARQRRQFGRRIGDFQLIQAKLADMYTETEAARWLVYSTAVRAGAAAAGSGQRFDKEAAAAILFAAEVSTRVANQAVQIHGGYGYMNEAPRLALPARRPAAGDRRRHERDPAPAHRPGADRARGVSRQ